MIILYNLHVHVHVETIIRIHLETLLGGGTTYKVVVVCLLGNKFQEGKTIARGANASPPF